MRAAVSKAEIEFDLASRFSDAFKIHEKAAVETLSAGIPEVDSLTGGLPRGSITEIFGPASSGRTSMMFSMLAHATTHEEICALVDVNDAFAPSAAVNAGINFDRLLWIRCGGSLENAFKATDMLLHAGGFGLVILDLADVAGKEARRIIPSWWYRFRRTVENKPASIVVMSEEPCTRSCSALTLELKGTPEWSQASVEQAKVVPIETVKGRKGERVSGSKVPVSPRPRVPLSFTQGNLLRFNSIKVNRQRPLSPWRNESEFRACRVG